jgi:phosphoglycerate dehydrogenase-like enzyme
MRRLLILSNSWFEVGSARLMRLAEEYPAFTIAYHPVNDIPPAILQDAEIIFGNLPPARLPEAANLRWLHLGSAGANGFCNPALYARADVVVTKSSGVFGIPIAEHILGMFLALSRRFGEYNTHQRAHQWARDIDGVRELTGSAVLVLGAGDIGTTLARLLEPFGCRRIGLKRDLSRHTLYFDELIDRRGLLPALAKADYIACCLPGTPGTAKMMNAEAFASVKQGAVFVNAGRGSVVDTEALTDALAKGRLHGAGLDVTDPEPLPPGHPLWDMENVIITPHVSAGTDFINERRLALFLELMNCYAAGKALWNRVDFYNGY